MSGRRALAFSFVGLGWGVVAFLLGARAVGPPIVLGVVASPLIGITVGAAVHRRFEAHSRRRRAFLALGSLYLGATLFGAAIGIGDWINGSAHRSVEVVWEGVAAVWYGVTLFVIVLWPLAYLSHVALASDVAWWRRPQ